MMTFASVLVALSVLLALALFAALVGVLLRPRNAHDPDRHSLSRTSPDPAGGLTGFTWRT